MLAAAFRRRWVFSNLYTYWSLESRRYLSLLSSLESRRYLSLLSSLESLKKVSPYLLYE